MARLRLEDVSKTFARRGRARAGTVPAAIEALRDIELDVADGATLAVVGPSGCGKTTLLRVIAGLERPDRGHVRLGDRDVTEAPVAGRGVGFVFQGLALFDHMDVSANIGYGVNARGARRGEIVRAAAGRARATGVLGERPGRLSGGERQRVALARALATGPDVLVLDEPFASLDAPLRAELRVELARARRDFGATTVLVTHDRADAFALGDRVGVMDRGRVVQVDTPEAMLERPATSFVATFLGTPGLALVDGRYEDGTFRAPGGIALALGLALAAGDARAGIRAERVRLEPAGLAAGRIVAVEHDPSGALAHLDGAFGTLVARVPRELMWSVRAGDDVRFSVDPAGTHLFAAGGLRIGTA